MKLKPHYASYELRGVKEERIQFPIQKELFDLLPDLTKLKELVIPNGE